MNNNIKYICLLDEKNNPIVSRNYNNFDEAYIELILNSQCDLIELAFQISTIYGFMGQIGILNDLKIYGYMSMTEKKIIMICTQHEKRPKDILKQIYEIYKSHILNPFFENQEYSTLQQKIDQCMNEYTSEN